MPFSAALFDAQPIELSRRSHSTREKPCSHCQLRHETGILCHFSLFLRRIWLYETPRYYRTHHQRRVSPFLTPLKAKFVPPSTLGCGIGSRTAVAKYSTHALPLENRPLK